MGPGRYQNDYRPPQRHILSNGLIKPCQCEHFAMRAQQSATFMTSLNVWCMLKSNCGSEQTMWHNVKSPHSELGAYRRHMSSKRAPRITWSLGIQYSYYGLPRLLGRVLLDNCSYTLVFAQNSGFASIPDTKCLYRLICSLVSFFSSRIPDVQFEWHACFRMKTLVVVEISKFTHWFFKQSRYIDGRHG